MLKPRLIPVLLLKDGVLVRSKTFTFHQLTGNPTSQVQRFSDWKADELIYLDINREDASHDYRETMNVIGTTSSLKNAPATMTNNFIDIIRFVSEKCFIPLTVGGKIRALEDIRIRLQNGADKVAINTQAIEDPSFIEKAARAFGSQCIVLSVDVKYDPETKSHEVFSHFGKRPTGLSPIDWCREAEHSGAGEILLQSIDRDGTGLGYDIEITSKVADAVSIPVIALGGVGKFEHFVEGLKKGNASAVAAANIFHFSEHSVMKAKKAMKAANIDVRLY